jgi:hypothetical protein
MLSTLTASEISITGATTATISRMHVCSGTSADYTVTLPAVSGNTGKFIGFRMAPGLTKFVTLDGNGSETIDGATTRVMWALEVAILYCDGSTWTRVAGRFVQMNCKLAMTGTAQGAIGTGSTVAQLNSTVFDNTGKMADLANYRIVIKRTGSYRVWGSVGFTSSTGGAALGVTIPTVGCTITGCIPTYGPGLNAGYVAAKSSEILTYNAGDVVTISAYRDSTTATVYIWPAWTFLAAEEIQQW